MTGANSAGGGATATVEGAGSAPWRSLAVRRDDSWAGNKATMQPATSNPATMTIAVRDMANPTCVSKTDLSRRLVIGARDLAD